MKREELTSTFSALGYAAIEFLDAQLERRMIQPRRACIETWFDSLSMTSGIRKIPLPFPLPFSFPFPFPFPFPVAFSFLLAPSPRPLFFLIACVALYRIASSSLA